MAKVVNTPAKIILTNPHLVDESIFSDISVLTFVCEIHCQNNCVALDEFSSSSNYRFYSEE